MQTKVHSFAKFLYNHNPFYLLSAAFVLYGLHAAFGSRTTAPEHVWLLASSLCGYTLLLALTAYLVVRLGKVWEDARSILLIVVLMFVAISVSFDEICNTLPRTANTVLAIGLVFSILVSEGLIRSLKIKFPVSYRLPLYLTFALFFLYPLWVSPNVTEQTDLVVAWRVFSFPLAAAVITLMLLPAVRRGSSCLQKNGTPWGWPWYPWPLFVILALGVCIRSYVLTLSFQAAQGLETSFSLYYLTPFFFAVLIVLSEIGFVERSRHLQTLLLQLTPAILIVGLPVGHGASFDVFLSSVVANVGSPFWIALLALVGFYAYLWGRGMKHAEFACIVALLVATIVGSQTIDVDSLSVVQWWPLAAIGGVQAIRTILTKSSIRFVISASSVLAATTCCLPEAWFDLHVGAIVVHVAAIVFVVAGFVFNDHFAWLIRRMTPIVIIFPAAAVAAAGDHVGANELIRTIYVACFFGITMGAWLATRDRLWQMALVVNSASFVLAVVSWAYTGIQDVIPPRALAALAGGIACFLVAALISALKGGFGKQIRCWWDDAWHGPPRKLKEDRG